MTMTRLTLLIACCLCASAAMSQQARIDAAAVQRWLAGYEAAWERRDANAAMALFTADATYHETPYADPFRGREAIGEYWASVTADQRDVEFAARVLAIDGNIGVVEWSATFTSAANGERVGLDGVFVLTFENAERCRELREWWFVRPSE